MLDVYWLDISASREEMIPVITEVFWDQVLQWLFTGNLIPKAAGKHGGLLDLMETAPNRPGKFWALERRFRAGVTDNIGRTTLEAFEIVMSGRDRKLNLETKGGRAASGSMLVLEGADIHEDDLATIARDIFCNELIESWTILPEIEIKNNDRFHQERIKRDLPKVGISGSDQVKCLDLSSLDDSALISLSQKNLWALTLEEMKAIRDYFKNDDVRAKRQSVGLFDPTDVELEVLAQTWSEHCKHKIFGAKFQYDDAAEKSDSARTEIPTVVDNLFKTTIVGTTRELPKPWLLSVFHDNAGIIAFDQEDAFCIKAETHNSPSALDPYGGALTGIVGVNRDILGCGLGAKPMMNTDVFCVAPLDYSKVLPDRLLHPRRILDGVRLGVEHGGNKSGIPTVNGALVFDDRFVGKPLVFCGTGGFMPRTIAGRPCESKEIRTGDRICMVGGRIGKDGIHGATFSSLALDENSPATAVQLGDPITQKRMADFLLEARDLGLYRAITDNGAGGLSSSVGEMAGLAGGANMDVSLAKTKYPGLKPYELVVSESQERMTVAVPPETLPEFLALAQRRAVEVSDLGEFTDTGRFDIQYQGKIIASLDLEFLHDGVPRLELNAKWSGRPIVQSGAPVPFGLEAADALLKLLNRPNIASKEWLIRQYDHEVQGSSVIKPLHTAGVGTASPQSGPNDGAVVKPKSTSESGIAIACGINPKLSDIDPYLMAQSAVDESIRNVLCVGAEFGRPESIVALVDNFCWPDPVPKAGVDESDAWAKAGALVRACYGLRKAALELSAPLVSGKDSMKNDFRGKQDGKPVAISVPPTLLMTAVARVADVRYARTADFKRTGDSIYLIGGKSLGIIGSELQVMSGRAYVGTSAAQPQCAEPNWEEARCIFSWIGGGIGKERVRLRSLHDVSEGGVLVAVAESMIARGLGARLNLPAQVDPWEIGFGEGFHSFVATLSDEDVSAVEAEWAAHGVPFLKLGVVTNSEKLEVTWGEGATVSNASWSVPVKQLQAAWQKGGYWE